MKIRLLTKYVKKNIVQKKSKEEIIFIRAPIPNLIIAFVNYINPLPHGINLYQTCNFINPI